MVMIAAAVGAAVKWFGSKRDDADDDVQGDDPIVRAMFKAVNEGDIDGLREYIADSCRFTVNSIDIAREGNLTSGFDLLADGIKDTHEALPDLRWELYDELTGEDEGKHKIAIRLVSSTTIDGTLEDFEVACFGIVEDEKLVEWHQVADLDTYNERRSETGEGALSK